MSKCRLVKFCLVFASLLIFCACMASPEQKLIKLKCSNPACHSVSTVYNAHKSQNQWANTVRAMEVNMTKKGMGMNADERQTIINYLSANYGL